MSALSSIAGDLQAITSELKVAQGSTLRQHYNRARLAYLDNTAEALKGKIEVGCYDVEIESRRGMKKLTVVTTRQERLFMNVSENEDTFSVELKLKKDDIVWEQHRVGHEVASGSIDALENTPDDVADEIHGKLIWS